MAGVWDKLMGGSGLRAQFAGLEDFPWVTGPKGSRMCLRDKLAEERVGWGVDPPWRSSGLKDQGGAVTPEPRVPKTAVGTVTKAAATHMARVATRAQKSERWAPGPAAMATTQYRATLNAVMRKMLA